MYIVSVRFKLNPPATLETISKTYRSLSPKYRDVKGLLKKYYIFGNENGGAIYVWDSRESAENFFTPEWKSVIASRYGNPPQLEWLDNPVVVDNVAGKIESNAA